jgi:ribonuclease J
MIIHTIGGFDEVGKNMTALEIDNDVLVLDDGLFLPAIVGVEEREKIITEKGMRGIGALPDDDYLDENGLQDKVRALLISHAHLDHVGAIPYNSYRYNAPVLGTPFTMEVLKVLMEDNEQRINNKIIPIKVNGSYIVNGKNDRYKVEFINMTHSTPQTAAIAVHTRHGIVLYVNDYKLDNSPILGDKPNYKRLQEIAKMGVKVLIINSLYAPKEAKTPSEKIARGLLEDVLFGTENRKSAVIITTFSSHIARLKSITEFGHRMGREVVFLGRSLGKYITAARRAGIADFLSRTKICTYRKQVEKILKQVDRNRERIAKEELPISLRKEDQIIFSSQTIPSTINEANKAHLEKRLKKHNVRIFDNVHCSGHGAREDLRDFINMTKPEHIIPAHGDLKKTTAGVMLAEELGYKLGKNVHLMQNHKSLEVK